MVENEEKEPEEKRKREKGLVDWKKATTDEKDRIYRQAAYLYSKGEGEAYVAYHLARWLNKNFRNSNCYRSKELKKGGKEKALDRHWVHRRIGELVKNKYLTLREPERDSYITPVEDILGRKTGLKGIELHVAAHRDDMLRKAVLRLETLLTEKLEAAKDKSTLILTASGGQTLLNFAHSVAQTPMPTLQSVVRDPEWLREKLLVCSLTSGGMRDNISALSDTVTAIMANNLGCGARGLLGPAWFEKTEDMQIFDELPDVQKHKNLVQKAEIILTSVGWLGNETNLMARLLEKSNSSKSKKKDELESDHPADLLYNLYDGWSGEDLDLPEDAQGHFFSVMSLENLRKRIEDEKKRPAVIVLASGWAKGYNAVLGLIHGKLATEIFLDAESAAGLRKAVEEYYHITSG